MIQNENANIKHQNRKVANVICKPFSFEMKIGIVWYMGLYCTSLAIAALASLELPAIGLFLFLSGSNPLLSLEEEEEERLLALNFKDLSAPEEDEELAPEVVDAAAAAAPLLFLASSALAAFFLISAWWRVLLKKWEQKLTNLENTNTAGEACAQNTLIRMSI